MRRSKVVSALLLPFVLLAAASAAQGQQVIPDERLKKIEAVIAAAMSRQNIPAFSVAIVTDNRLRWSRAYGMADVENSVPANPATVYRIASVSKPITAVAAMQLFEKGKLDLDAPIQRYCPAFPEKPWKITARQLLGHLGGIRHYKQDENFNSTRHYGSVAESLDAFKNDPLLQEPGTKFTYSTYGYVVLGCVVEGASGMKYADYVREHIFRPAGMERTRLDDHYAIIQNRARGYARLASGELRDADLADTSNKIPGGGLVSTPEDMAKFAVAVQTGVLLKKETFEQMLKPMKTADGKESPYFGWYIRERGGERLLTHGGSQQGTSTQLLFMPGRGVVLVLMANMEEVNQTELAIQITNILLQ
ncbi:MAG TPA: serine hydrolase domain-containing protein [Pyrinomonadaceae bacterium]|nr:serine hydrolase domain-containing protein [Pyrinomonadaceae bacterium]